MHLITTSAAALLLLSVVSATPQPISNTPKRMTNAELLRRGLAPMPPMFRRGALPGGQHLPTKTSPEKRAPSASPSSSSSSVTYNGRIIVKTFEGASFGYVENTVFGGVDGVTFDTPIAQLQVQFATDSTGTGPFNILATNAHFRAPHFLGGSTVNSTRLGPNNSNGVTFHNVRQTPANSHGAQGESSIWSIDPTTRQITAHWVNPDGSKFPTHIGLDTKNNAIIMTGNVTLYNQHHPYPIIEVFFFLANMYDV